MSNIDPKKGVAIWVIKIGLGLLFLYAGMLKLLDPSAFSEEIGNYQLFPELATYMAATMPMVEIVVGIALIAIWSQGPWFSAVILGTIGMYTMFVFVTI